ncbi:DUF4116 domain-containing protein [Streptobacillus moniliformis]|nr:DUF4116 domain-containing protein [Streptobacillus moniliformis]
MDWNNKELVLLEVKKNGWSLKYASDRLKDDKEVVLEAVKKMVGL